MSEAGEERRLTTILAADVVGYSGLMAADESGTLAQLKAHRKEVIEPKTAEYRGRVVKLMGDGCAPRSANLTPPLDVQLLRSHLRTLDLRPYYTSRAPAFCLSRRPCRFRTSSRD